MTAAPAQTSVSLLASATVRPAATAAKVGSNPAAPTIAGDHQIGVAQRGFLDRLRAGGDFDLEPREPRLQLGVPGWVGEGGEFGAKLDRAFRQRRAVAAAGDRNDRESAPARRR